MSQEKVDRYKEQKKNRKKIMKKEKLDGEDVLILSENDILAVVED